MLSTAVIVGSLLERDMAVRAISQTNERIAGIIQQFLVNEDTVRVVLEELDILYRLRVIETFINSTYGRSVTSAIFVKQPPQSTLTILIQGIHEICENIHKELDTIHTKIKNHRMKYFYYMRSFDIAGDMEQLRRHSAVLDGRWQLLYEYTQTQGRNVSPKQPDIQNDL
jgi:hypothetical protein